MTDSLPLVVVAPDSFKGSCDSVSAASALARGVRLALGDTVRIRELPLADGGEGTLDALTAAWGGTVRTAPTTDALGRPRAGRFGLSADGRTAIIEAAEANGLPHVGDVAPQPLDADSRGVGLLARAALGAGATEILLCVGGSATNDGGAGLLVALGARLLDSAGNELAPGPRGLAQLDRVDLTGLFPAARDARWRVAVDVDNPLTGPRGAAAVFGPQKGATPDDVAAIDAALGRFARVLTPGPGLESRPGMGAAGGLPLALVSVFGAEVTPGADLVARAVHLDAALGEAALVITGEGRLDAQSLDGKVLSRILLGTPSGTPVIAVVGALALSASECRAAGLTAALSIAQGPATLDELTARTSELLTEAAAHACALVGVTFVAG